MSESIRDRVVRLIQEMRNRTTDRGATPQEAAAFAAKVAEWIEKYQISEAELRNGAASGEPEVCQEFIETDRQVFNPGMTALVNSLCCASSCKLILLNKQFATYGIVGDPVDCHFIRHLASVLVPRLRLMATLEGREHGCEKAGLVRWTNQYLTGAGETIYQRIVDDRRARSEVKQIEHEEARLAGRAGALVCVTGDTLAIQKKEATEKKFKKLYPSVRNTRSRAEHNDDARAQGRKAGERVGIHLNLK